jgi:hypothetical protein
MSAGPSRRRHVQGGRPHVFSVSFSEDEFGVVCEAAGRDGLAPGAWVSEAAVRSARNTVVGAELPAGWGAAMQRLMPLQAELAEHRRVLRNVGGNLNDVARHANSTSEVHPATANVLAIVARVVNRVEAAIGHVEQLTAAARGELVRSRR